MPPVERRPWRSIAEAERDPAFLARIAGEFPSLAEAVAHPLDRRRVLRLMAASFAMTGLSACDPAGEDGQLVPAVIAPPDIVAGLANRYASASLGGGEAVGVVVTHQMGRPIKVEGNPDHPSSLGATDVFAQASLLDFYDPDRAAGLMRHGLPSDRQTLLTELAARRSELDATHGAGLRILTGPVLAPTLARQIGAVLARYPEARWHRWDPLGGDARRQGAARAYGRAADVLPRPGAARVIVAFDSDLLSGAPGSLAHARAFAERRNPVRAPWMSRVYAIEPTPTLIGTMADHRIVAAPGDLRAMLAALASGVFEGARPSDPRIAAILDDLRAHPGEALVHGGTHLAPEALALIHAINEALGGRSRTFDVVEPAETGAAEDFPALAADMRAGGVTALFVLGANPGYTAPPALGFADAMERVPFSLVLGVTPDETAQHATWFVPATHDFEHWSDARAADGTATILQPQSLPLYDGVSPHTLLDWLLGPDARAPRDTVRETWSLPDDAWRGALAAGVVVGSASPLADVTLRAEARAFRADAGRPGLSVLTRPDPHLLDGRHANNPWLQECPRPLTKVVWDNPLLISPKLARDHDLANGAEVRLTAGTVSVEACVFAVPGQADDVIVALQGGGRRAVGRVGENVGFYLGALRDATGPITIEKTGRQHPVATTDHHNVLSAESRPGPDIIRRVVLDAVQVGLPAKSEARASLYPEVAQSAQKWGMSIDLNACIGCNACVVACQAENNVPTVGREQVLMEREMHWLRIDRYYEGTAENPDAVFQPMLCQHCEEAPCEVVCPVEATLHDSEGLNLMVYNRCVGTRFCSNNCPYKVRRFNFGAWAREERRPEISRNPDVTVRARGVMEKCTFCVQRIAEARVAADIGNRPIQDGEVVTACQAACPTRAFAFGNIADAVSEVSRRKASPLDYAVLEDRATHPRTTYEARVRNPNPAFGRSA